MIGDVRARLLRTAVTSSRDHASALTVSPGRAACALAKTLKAVAGAADAVEKVPSLLREAYDAFQGAALEHARHRAAEAAAAHDEQRQSRWLKIEKLWVEESRTEEVWLCLTSAWPRVGLGPLAGAIRDAIARPIALRPPLDRYGPTFRLVVSVAYWLSIQTTRAEVALPQTKIAAQLGVSQSAVGSAIHLAVRDGLLRKAAEAYHPVRHGPQRLENGRPRPPVAATYCFAARHLYAPPEQHVGDGHIETPPVAAAPARAARRRHANAPTQRSRSRKAAQRRQEDLRP